MYYDNQIEYIMNNFDFVRVHKVMEALDWTWASAKTRNGIPSVSELREQAERLLTEVENYQFTSFVKGGTATNSSNNNANSNNGYYSIETGGFKAETMNDSTGHRYLRLSFSVAEWESYGLGSIHSSN